MSSVKQRYTNKYNTLSITTIVAVLVLYLLSTNAKATTVHQSIENQIHTYIKAQLDDSSNKKTEINVSKIDRRKKLAVCQTPLEIKVAGKQGLKRNSTIHVSCQGTWNLYVPVQVKQLMSVIVAAKNLSPGTLLNKSNLKKAYADMTITMGQTVEQLSQVTGSKVKRYIQQGRPILFTSVCLVCRGDPVSIYAKKGSLIIKSSGIALNDGSIGQIISVKNSSSGRTVEGTVVAVGEIEIKL
ncbi:flagellar basal body P-ring formation chaperone FlgA [Psychrobium sp. 1_MG-2023]|uniref:flagellar basal body P-ring formation chaperone FlgA n=1 Tax=Psychrobium sp. 1_MG-2023 TaxID=3062624 RepID=UPI000C325AA1|nr:flagellar basal body P-ring formation chaperone FlgA [Psychrobium sp. 1_MG-2023]MDP2559876.1 flagellar basal body P-ring formation chaperone FlgA [Psychrobium sp. 1_MG-2023]PKF59023.1 flagella basal body P-ring formation protein FlgA [Alteromonadales bacterium alter-6D02]